MRRSIFDLFSLDRCWKTNPLESPTNKIRANEIKQKVPRQSTLLEKDILNAQGIIFAVKYSISCVCYSDISLYFLQQAVCLNCLNQCLLFGQRAGSGCGFPDNNIHCVLTFLLVSGQKRLLASMLEIFPARRSCKIYLLFREQESLGRIFVNHCFAGERPAEFNDKKIMRQMLPLSFIPVRSSSVNLSGGLSSEYFLLSPLFFDFCLPAILPPG